MSPVVHFEMSSQDGRRASKFCRSAFWWQRRMLGEETGRYVLATTVETGPKGLKRVGAINEGFWLRKRSWPAQYPSVVIAVKDTRQALAKVMKASGTVLGEPPELPNVGSDVAIMDPEGKRVSMREPVPVSWHAGTKRAKDGGRKREKTDIIDGPDPN